MGATCGIQRRAPQAFVPCRSSHGVVLYALLMLGIVLWLVRDQRAVRRHHERLLPSQISCGLIIEKRRAVVETYD